MQNTNKKNSSKKSTQIKKRVEPKTIKTTKISSKQKVNNISNSKKKEEGTNVLLTVLGIVVLAVVAILIFRLIYAYFTVNVSTTDPDKENAVVKTADLIVRYEDGSSNMSIGDKIEPGDVITKEFSVVNDGNDTGIYTIVLENIEHNLGHEENESNVSDVKYTLSRIDELNNKTMLSTGNLPFNKTQDIIYTKDEVLVNKTNKYLLEVEYINHINIDQTDSMGENLKLKVNIINFEGEERTTE